MFVLHGEARFGFCAGNRRHENIAVRLNNRPQVIVEILVLFVYMRPEGQKFLFSVVRSTVRQGIRKFEHDIVRQGGDQVCLVVGFESGECLLAGLHKVSVAHLHLHEYTLICAH
jgi:hypothetical protein